MAEPDGTWHSLAVVQEIAIVQPSFSGKGQTVNIIGSTGRTVSVAIPQLCLSSMQSALDNTAVKVHGFLVNLYLQKQVAGRVLLLTSAVALGRHCGCCVRHC